MSSSYQLYNIDLLAKEPLTNIYSFTSFNFKNKVFVSSSNTNNCSSNKCLIHNFPERELKECVISSENSFESIMTPYIIDLYNDFVKKSYNNIGLIPITLNNVSNLRFSRVFIEFVYIYSKTIHNLNKLMIVNVDYRYYITKCIDFTIGLNNAELCVLNHKKFTYLIFKKLTICKCLNNDAELILKNFNIFLNKLYFDNLYNNTYNMIDRQWIKQRLLIISMNNDPKIKVDYMDTVLLKDITN